jgi:hypothetical protein
MCGVERLKCVLGIHVAMMLDLHTGKPDNLAVESVMR